MQKVLLLIAAFVVVGSTEIARAEDLSLDCQYGADAGQSFHIDVDQDGLVSTSGQYRTIYQNKKDDSSEMYFRISSYEIAYGSRYRLTGDWFDAVINRADGTFSITSTNVSNRNLDKKWSGTCKKAERTPTKF